MRPRATSRARRVFPEPPAPVRVMRRVVASSCLTSSVSCSLPTKLLRAADRLCPGVLRGWCVLPVLKTSRFDDTDPASPKEVRHPYDLASRRGYLSRADHDASQGEMA